MIAQKQAQGGRPFAPEGNGAQYVDPMKGLLNLIPDKMLGQAGGMAGGMAGASVPFPFAATGMSAAGNLLGQNEVRARQQYKGQPQQPFNFGQSAESGAGTLAAAGVARGLQMLPFLHAPTAANFENEVASQFGQKYSDAYTDFSGQLQGLVEKNPNATVDVSSVMPTQAAQQWMLNNRSVTSAMKLYGAKFGDNTFEQLATGALDPSSLTPLQAQHLANTLDMIPGAQAESMGIKKAMMKAFPEAVSGIRQGYAQTMGQLEELQPFMSKQIGLSGRVGSVANEPSFESFIQQQFPSDEGAIIGKQNPFVNAAYSYPGGNPALNQMKSAGLADTIRNLPKKILGQAERAATFSATRGAIRK